MIRQIPLPSYTSPRITNNGLLSELSALNSSIVNTLFTSTLVMTNSSGGGVIGASDPTSHSTNRPPLSSPSLSTQVAQSSSSGAQTVDSSPPLDIDPEPRVIHHVEDGPVHVSRLAHHRPH